MECKPILMAKTTKRSNKNRSGKSNSKTKNGKRNILAMYSYTKSKSKCKEMKNMNEKQMQKMQRQLLKNTFKKNGEETLNHVKDEIFDEMAERLLNKQTWTAKEAVELYLLAQRIKWAEIKLEEQENKEA